MDMTEGEDVLCHGEKGSNATTISVMAGSNATGGMSKGVAVWSTAPMKIDGLKKRVFWHGGGSWMPSRPIWRAHV